MEKKIRENAVRMGHEIRGKLERVELPKVNGKPVPAMWIDAAGTAYFPGDNGEYLRIVENFVPAA